MSDKRSLIVGDTSNNTTTLLEVLSDNPHSYEQLFYKITQYVTERNSLEYSLLKKWHDEVLAVCYINSAEVPCTRHYIKLAVKERCIALTRAEVVPQDSSLYEVFQRMKISLQFSIHVGAEGRKLALELDVVIHTLV